MDLCDLKIVNFLYHLLELSHDWLHLALIGDACLSKDRLILLRLRAWAESELLLLLPFEDNTDQEFHAEPNDALFVWIVDIDGIW